MLVVDEAELLFSFANLGDEGTCVLGSRCGNAVFIGLLQFLCEESSGRVVFELAKTMEVVERTFEHRPSTSRRRELMKRAREGKREQEKERREQEKEEKETLRRVSSRRKLRREVIVS